MHAPASGPARRRALSIALVAGAVVAVAFVALVVTFFVRTGDAMVLIFGGVAALTMAVVVYAVGLALGSRQAAAARADALPRDATALRRCAACASVNAADARRCEACGRAL